MTVSNEVQVNVVLAVLMSAHVDDGVSQMRMQPKPLLSSVNAAVVFMSIWKSGAGTTG